MANTRQTGADKLQATRSQGNKPVGEVPGFPHSFLPSHPNLAPAHLSQFSQGSLTTSHMIRKMLGYWHYLTLVVLVPSDQHCTIQEIARLQMSDHCQIIPSSYGGTILPLSHKPAPHAKAKTPEESIRTSNQNPGRESLARTNRLPSHPGMGASDGIARGSKSPRYYSQV